MAAKKGSRSTRATKASTKAASSDIVLDENVDVPSELVESKKKSTKSATSSKKVLGERNAPNGHSSSPSKDSAQLEAASAKASSQKSTKSKRGKRNEVAEEDKLSVESESRATTPIPSSPTKKRLPEDQVQAFLQNYDLEVQTRLSRLRASLEISVQSNMTRMLVAIERIPRAVRQLTMAEFIDDYNADIHAFMNRAPVQHLKETQEQWDQIREERSPVKAKRFKKDEVTAAKASSSSSRGATTSSSSSAAQRGKKSTRSTKAPTRPAATSPLQSSASSKPAPSLSKFQPDLPKQALQTPKPRAARPGEMVQWQSINGSPICGVIGEDGFLRPVMLA